MVPRAAEKGGHDDEEPGEGRERKTCILQKEDQHWQVGGGRVRGRAARERMLGLLQFGELWPWG